jgi:hypothetical protein
VLFFSLPLPHSLTLTHFSFHFISSLVVFAHADTAVANAYCQPATTCEQERERYHKKKKILKNYSKKAWKEKKRQQQLAVDRSAMKTRNMNENYNK